jgi:hypothetical protein
VGDASRGVCVGGRAPRPARLALWPLGCPLDMSVGWACGRARGRGRALREGPSVGRDGMEGEGSGMGGWEIGVGPWGGYGRARASGFEGPGFGGLDSTRNPCTTKRAVPRPSGASLGLSSGAALPRASL